MNDIDVSGRMNREQFEELTHDLFERLRHLLQELLNNARKFYHIYIRGVKRQNRNKSLLY